MRENFSNKRAKENIFKNSEVVQRGRFAVRQNFRHCPSLDLVNF